MTNPKKPRRSASKAACSRTKNARKAAAAHHRNLGKILQIGKVSSASVLKHTGKNWEEWVQILDEAGAKTWPYREITMLLKNKHKLSPWWQQGVALAYELHHGRRVAGRNQRGEYSTVATKTLALSTRRAWGLITSEKGMRAWLRPFAPFPWKPGQGFEVDGGVFGEIRTLKAGVRARLTWQEAHWEKPSVVQIHLVPRKGEKCVMVIQHEGIPSAGLKERLREQWKQALASLSGEAE